MCVCVKASIFGEIHILRKLVALRETLAGDLLIDYEKMEKEKR